MLELITKSQGKSFSKSNEEILYIWKPQIETSASMLHVYAAIYSITNSHGYFGMGE